MSRFVRWLDRYIYVDKLRPRRPVRPALPRMSTWQWARFLGHAVFVGAVYVGGQAAPVPGVLAFLLTVIVIGVASALLMPDPATDGSAWAMPWLTFAFYVLSVTFWVQYGSGLLALVGRL